MPWYGCYYITYDNVMYYFKSFNCGLYSYRGIYVSTIFTHLKKYTIINYDTMYQLGQLETYNSFNRTKDSD